MEVSKEGEKKEEKEEKEEKKEEEESTREPLSSQGRCSTTSRPPSLHSHSLAMHDQCA